MKSTKLKYLPNVLTFCNMAIGILVICLVIHNCTISVRRLTCFLVYAAVILDVFDGLLARYLNVASDMGKQLDSFADIITFGVAPITIFMANLNTVPWYIMFVLLLYPLAGGFRLARYNLQEDSDFFIGLPITASGFIMVTVLLINSFKQAEITVKFIVFYLILVLVLSILMVSKFKVKRLIRSK